MATEKTKPKFVVCVKNDGYLDDLKIRTVYQVLPDASAARSKYIRVIDETGEDYLFPADYFVPIEVPPKTAKSLMIAIP